MKPRLLTTPASHYCEKARWALDRARIDYVEEAHAPLFARVFARLAGSAGTVPALVCDDGVLGDSTDILRWVSHRLPLFPEGAAALEEKLDEGLGRAARVVLFHHAAANRTLALRMSTRGVPGWERALASAFFAVARLILARIYRVSPESLVRSVAEIRRTFADVGARLADGRRYLCGDAFSAADLTFASLANLVLLAEGTHLADLAELPPVFSDLVTELRAAPAGRFALRLYAEERRS